MMFASKTPRDLNHDPGWVCAHCGGDSYEHCLATNSCVWEPIDPKRPEFDHPQHNEPNRILVEFRRGTGDIATHATHYLAYLDTGDVYDWRFIPAHERMHARRVLERLARFPQSSGSV